jgi:hypothetical protein
VTTEAGQQKAPSRCGARGLELRRILSPARLLAYLLWSVLFILFINAFGIFTPVMPGVGLGFGWTYGINQAVAQNLTFGKDIIFTFGPYASVYTHSYHPATVGLMIFGITLLDVFYLICFSWLVKDARWRFPLILISILAVPILSQDAFLFSVPFLFGLLLFKLHCRINEDAFAKTSTQLFLVFALVCLGLLPLIKGTILMAAIGNLVACAIFLAMNRHPFLAANCIATPTIAMITFWVASGQKWAALPGFFLSLKSIVSGYSEAMAVWAPAWLSICFTEGCAAVLLFILLKKGLSESQRLFLLMIYGMLFFFGFKAGFVRQDSYSAHIPTAMGCLLLGSLFLFLLQIDKRSFANYTFLVIPLLCAGFVGFTRWRAKIVSDISGNCPVYGRYAGKPKIELLRGLRHEMGDRKLLSIIVSAEPFRTVPWNFRMLSWHAQFDQAKQEIATISKLHFVMPGTADIYSYQQSSLLANGYAWNPRPVMQSYSAYTPQLIRLNEQHLRNQNAPDNIVFRMETIDGRFPSLDDGLSWPAMLDNYRVSEASESWIHLSRRSAVRTSSRYTTLGTMRSQVAKEVTVPAASGPIFAEISIKPSLMGKVLSVVYKAPSLALRVVSGDGKESIYRVNSNMMETGFFISPLVTTNDEFQSLFYPNTSVPNERRPRSIALMDGSEKHVFWNEFYTITFKQYLY